MAKSDNLTDFLKGLADKLRSVLGTAEPISPQEFEDKIQEVYGKGFAEGGPTGITAKADDVLAGKVFGSGGSAKATGTMLDQSNAIRTITTDTSDMVKGAFQKNGNDIWIAPGNGYWGNWDWSKSRLTIPGSHLASAIGLTAAKLLKGESVLGITGTGVSTPAQIGVKPILSVGFDDYAAGKNISAGNAPCDGTLRLWFVLLGSSWSDGVDYLKSGSRQVSGNDWNRVPHYRIDIATKKGEAISFKFKAYGNNSKGIAWFLYYTSVS